MVRVIDTGIGMTPEQQSRLFAPFVQADASTTRRFGGTGLGLAICKRLVEQMGGTLGVSSTEHRGATFWFEVALPTCAPLPATAAGAAVQRTFAARALLAEDNPVNVLVARGMLTRLGVEVVVARDGREALALLDEAHVDLIFTDLHMPELDGFELARRLRERGCVLPIIAVTADAMPEDRQRCLDVGMNDYVSKPFKQGDLERVLTRWLELRRAA
jgi:CheY-like chemotaxis protein